ncbi:Protein of unknown function [Corynebacterium mycetoides]|uniref:DUF2505 domain-containing protein n=1 Tax=Corynebacterium mycetoides TaxID=38302 RepID=A0A1G9Q909_9CORY|nr:DUF2505 domain-containing protein [Corynebacterium mycetoides]SDM07554.1 Protein of unknown function [Corynebacterium mycetoides]
MTAHSEVTLTINHSAAKVHQALTTKEYWEFIAEKLSPEPGTLNEFDGSSATLFEVLPQSILPEAARAMISQDLKLKRVVNVGALEGENAKLDFTGDVKGTPVDFSGDIALAGAGETTTLTYDNEVKVAIPFMGAALEPKIADALEEILTNEAALTDQWISDNL